MFAHLSSPFHLIPRIHKYANCSIECLILSLIYIDRLIQSGTIPVNSLTIHRVIITSVMLAIKFFDDAFFNNSFYARIGGIPTEELNSLELEFLKAINFSLLVTNDDYQKYYNELCMHANNGLCPYCCTVCPFSFHFLVSCPLPPLNECTEGRDRVLRYQSPKSCTPSPRNIAGYYPI